MNYYERVQKALDYIESNLENKIDINIAAQEAFMSQSNFYRMFFALVGYSVKEYIRLRRISLAACEIRQSNTALIDIAVKYDFDSSDAFSRAFKRITGFLPSEYRKEKIKYYFERINIMDKYFYIQDRELLDKYPDIKVLKEMEPIKVAYYCYFGKEPEKHAFEVIADWLNKNNLNINDQKLRIFGYNNPSPSLPEQVEYGYEVCVTISDDTPINDDRVKVKSLEGGLYAVTGIKRTEYGEIGDEIVNAWKRFGSWLKDSKYTYGGHQWLEEHLGFDDDANHIGGIDLYMPIAEKAKNQDTAISFQTVEPMWTATYTAKGKDAADKARAYFLNWAQNEGLFKADTKHRFFAYYNSEKIGHEDFFYKIHVTIDKHFQTSDPNIVFEEFKGGYYAVKKSKYKTNGWAWGEFIQWISKSEDYSLGKYWFFEEYKLNGPELEMETDMILHMPVTIKQ
jgi:DNA gyrase inhibitor GyrI/AraC-like DNA-binding protein